jgi:hypothetical protein
LFLKEKNKRNRKMLYKNIRRRKAVSVNRFVFLCPEKDGGMACWAFYKRRKKKEIIIKKEKETGWLL